MLPIKLNEEEIKDWQNMINKLGNGDENARINKKWYKTQKLGGLRFHNMRKYYIANNLRYIGGIISHSNKVIR